MIHPRYPISPSGTFVTLFTYTSRLLKQLYRVVIHTIYCYINLTTSNQTQERGDNSTPTPELKLDQILWIKHPLLAHSPACSPGNSLDLGEFHSPSRKFYRGGRRRWFQRPEDDVVEHIPPPTAASFVRTWPGTSASTSRWRKIGCTTEAYNPCNSALGPSQSRDFACCHISRARACATDDPVPSRRRRLDLNNLGLSPGHLLCLDFDHSRRLDTLRLSCFSWSRSSRWRDGH